MDEEPEVVTAYQAGKTICYFRCLQNEYHNRIFTAKSAKMKIEENKQEDHVSIDTT